LGVLGIHSSILLPLSFLLAHSPLSYVKVGVKTCWQCVVTPKGTNYVKNKFVSIVIMFLKHWSSNKPLFFVMGRKGEACACC
jgi:hypothetical protein